ncbi:MAG: AI-2E family transporter, partial [Methanomicrobiaceae archaeon]|nr:AI-2E family transporter [Methanomicrobiaceae archaeon]
ILTELGVLAAGFLVLIVAIVFMLGDFPGIAFRISQALGDTAALTAAFDRFNRRLTTYAAVKAGVGFITGGGLTVLLLIMGVETPILWGLLIFLFSFIPFIGLPIASVPPAGVAGLQYGIWGVAAVLAGVAIIDLAARTLLFPQRIDRICDLSNAVIMLSVFFWTWVLGVPGLFLAVPLTMFAKMGLESSDETRWMAVLLKPPITQE